MKACSKCHVRLTPTAVADVLPVIVLSALTEWVNLCHWFSSCQLFFFSFFFSLLLSLFLSHLKKKKFFFLGGGGGGSGRAMSVTRAKYGVTCQGDDDNVLHNFRE